MILKYKLRYMVFLLALITVVGFGHQYTFAADQKKKPVSVAKPNYDIGNGKIKVYGQVLSPGDISYSDSKDAWRWDDLKHLAVEVLPGADKKETTPEQLCDSIRSLTLQYNVLEEKVWMRVAELIMDHFPEIHDDPNITDQAAYRLRAKDSKVFEELITMAPEHVPKIMMARDIALKSMTMVFLEQASYNNCKAYALEKGYIVEEGN